MFIRKILALSLILLSFCVYAIDTDSRDATVAESSVANNTNGLAQKLGLDIEGSLGEIKEPLHPDKAFQISLNIENNRINATWKVTPGHYIYRDKIQFKIISPETASLGNPSFPESKTKQDDYLGNTEVYEHDFSVLVPLDASQANEVTIETTHQGCSENPGICYPPQKKIHTIKLATTPVTEASLAGKSTEPVSQTSNTPSALSSLAQKLGLGGSSEPLHPDKAFQLSVTSEGDRIIAHWKITPDHYLYRGKTKFKTLSPDTLKLASPVFPKSKSKQDQFLGNVEVYEHDFSVVLPVNSSQAGDVTLQTTYQGCSESSGICYPPQRKTHTIKLASFQLADQATNQRTNSALSNTALPVEQQASNSARATGTLGSSAKPAIVSEQDVILDKIKNKSTLGTVLMFLIFGLGLALTPCVFPMIPILSGIIAGQGENISTKKALALSIAYVIPMALVYAIVGVIAGLGGANIQILFQNPWVITSFAIVFVLLSLSMFGFYELQMPASVQAKLTSISNNQESGSYLGAAIMGVLSALIVGPCVTAPLIAALTYIAQTGDAIFGGLSLFSLGIGMGIPLIVLGTSAGKLLPKAGAWMDATKAAFGVLMLALAIWMLDRIVPFSVTMALSGILLIGTGCYLRGLKPTTENSQKWFSSLSKSLGFVFLLYGSVLLIGAAAGGKSLLQPLKGLFGNNAGHVTVVEEGLQFRNIANVDAFDAVMATAKQQNQTVMLDFYADWCVSCKEMEHTTFKNPGVISALKNVILIQADVTKNNADDAALLKKFGLFGPPGILFFTPDGMEAKGFRKVGYVKADRFETDINKFLNTF